MLQLEALLPPSLTFCSASGVSKKRVIEDASRFIAAERPDFDEKALFTNLLAREKLGSTALGDGIALPHCRLAGCETPTVALMTLANPVDFDAPDRQPVDVLFFLIVPEEAIQDHLDILATLAGLLSHETFCKRLRESTSAESLYHNAISYRP